MTERLAQLLRDEADTLDLPPPDAGTAMSRGRGLRRRRRLFTGVAAVAVLAVVGGTALGINALGGDDDAKTDPATASVTGAVFSIGTTVYFDDGAQRAEIDDLAIKSLYYTSAGVLVRHGENTWSDGGGPQRFSLVRPDGTVEPIDVTTEETVHSTDPTQPYLAYAEETDAGIDIVVHDVRDDTEAARVPIDGPFSADSWMPPPVSIDGDLVYVTTHPTAYVVDWRSGEVTETDAVEAGGFVEIHGGRQALTDRSGDASVVDVATGKTLLSAPMTKDQYGGFELSPDGRYALLSIEDMMSTGEAPSTFEIYDVDTGAHVPMPQGYYGWSVAGDLFSVSKGELTTCDSETGNCTSAAHGITMPPKTKPTEVCETFNGREQCYEEPGMNWEGTLKLGGRIYES